MALLSHKFSVMSNGELVYNLATHRVKRDLEVWGRARDTAPNPEAFFFMENVTNITKYWQFYLRAINYNMVLERVSAILNTNRMTTNGTGFGDNDPRQNWLLMQDINVDNKFPQWNKVYTSGDAKIRLIGNVVSCFDGRLPPPLKLGYRQPERVEDADIEMYLYTPYNAPHLFFDCHNVNQDGSYQPWPNSALYVGDSIPRTWMPFVSDVPVIYPPVQWKDVSARLAKL